MGADGRTLVRRSSWRSWIGCCGTNEHALNRCEIQNRTIIPSIWPLPAVRPYPEAPAPGRPRRRSADGHGCRTRKVVHTRTTQCAELLHQTELESYPRCERNALFDYRACTSTH